MSLTSNPFHILGAKMTDDRRRIVALAKEKSFGGDEEAVREAQSILLTPRKRLAAEIAWLPGVEPERIGELLWGLHSSASWRAAAAWATGWNTPSLAGANLLAHMGHYVDDGSLAWWVSLLAAAQRRVQADEVTALVNEARVAAGLPRASKQDVTEELRDRANSYLDTIERCLDTLETQRMAVVVTSVVNTATRKGTTHASALVDTLIDSYYDRRVSGTMDERRKGIENLAARVRADASGGRIARVPAIVGEIERALRAWDVLAQPIQVSLASRGMSHPPSDEIMRDTRNLAVFLINEHGVVFLEVARSLTETLRKVFAEMEPITEVLDEDAATLDGIAAKVPSQQCRQVSPAVEPPASTPAPVLFVRTARPRAWYALLAAIGLVVLNIGVRQGTLHSPTPSTGGPQSRDPLSELFERSRFMAHGRGSPSPEWLAVQRREGTLDDNLSLAKRGLEFIKSLGQGIGDVPVGVLEGIGILASDPNEVDENLLYQAGQRVRGWLESFAVDPRAEHSFFTSQVPRALGQFVPQIAATALGGGVVAGAAKLAGAGAKAQKYSAVAGQVATGGGVVWLTHACSGPIRRCAPSMVRTSKQQSAPRYTRHPSEHWRSYLYRGRWHGRHHMADDS